VLSPCATCPYPGGVKKAIALTALAAGAWSAVMHPWAWAFGIGVHPYPAGTPWTYQLWSGFLPSLTVATVIGSALSLYRLNNCHQDRCWRLGKHRVGGTPWCTRHVGAATPAQTDSELLAEIRDLLARIAGQRRTRTTGAPCACWR